MLCERDWVDRSANDNTAGGFFLSEIQVLFIDLEEVRV
jgi:hypothetical protein